jgi:hypothetical protein
VTKTHTVHEILDVVEIRQSLELEVEGTEGGDDCLGVEAGPVSGNLQGCVGGVSGTIIQYKGGSEEQGTYLFALDVPCLDDRAHALFGRKIFHVAPGELFDQHPVPGKERHALVVISVLDKVVQK